MSDKPADTLPVLRIELKYRDVCQRKEFREPTLRIGRIVPDRPIPEIGVEDDTVSRDQAEIKWHGRNYWLADQGSLTGTYLDDVRIVPGDRLPLTSGARLRFSETTATIHLERQNEHEGFDVFLCHSSGDKPQVRAIAARLRLAGINPWLDEEKLTADGEFLGPMCDVLRIVGKAAIIWGPHSPGRWQRVEIRHLMRMNVEQHLKLTPVILHGVEKDPEWPVFLDDLQRVDFRSSTPDPMQQLIWALKA